MHNQAAFSAEAPIGGRSTQQVITQARSYDWCCPLHTCCQAPQTIMPMHDIEIAGQGFEKYLRRCHRVTQWNWPRLRMNNLYFQACSDQRVGLAFNKCS